MLNITNSTQERNIMCGCVGRQILEKSLIKAKWNTLPESKMAATSPPTWERMTLARKREGRSMEAGGREIGASWWTAVQLQLSRTGGLKTPECLCLTEQAHVLFFFLTVQTLALSKCTNTVCECLCVKCSVSHVDKTLSLDATASRTSQCAVEDMWSEHNPLLYFTSSFTTQIQT